MSSILGSKPDITDNPDEGGKVCRRNNYPRLVIDALVSSEQIYQS
jgi:hypothetical protein